jgi:hypothetical protein
MRLAIENDREFFIRNNELEQVKDGLADLWTLRSGREPAFAEVVNMLQCVFANRNVEDFTSAQMAVLRDVFLRLCAESVVDDDFVNSISFELLRGDVDIFRELE